MAGMGLGGDVVTFAATTLTHVTGHNLNVSRNQITQEVADSAAALSLGTTTVKSVTVSGVVPTAGAATLMNALDAGAVGSLSVELKDSFGGSTVMTWTSVDALSESQGATVTAGQNFTSYQVTFSTNGGTWA